MTGFRLLIAVWITGGLPGISLTACWADNRPPSSSRATEGPAVNNARSELPVPDPQTVPEVISGRAAPRGQRRVVSSPSVPNSPVLAPLPARSFRPWMLYFPSDWRHPAIQYPPVKVYLDPPYGVHDPFGRLRGSGTPQPTAPRQRANTSRQDARGSAAPARSKVLEWNSDAGKWEDGRSAR